MTTAKDRRKQIHEQMQKRHEEAYKRKDDSGKYKSIFEQRLSTDRRFKCTEGDHSLDFIPYPAGPNDPHNEEGTFTFSLDVIVHRKVGINEDDYLCLNRNYKGKCPICNYQIQLQKQGETDDAIISALNPTRRVIYNVWCHDNSKEEAKGVQIWDVSQWAFDSNLQEQAKKKKGGGYIYFSDPDTGKIVSFRRIGMGPKNTKYVAISFEDRDAPIPDEIMDQAQSQCLDKLIHVPTYEEVAEAFFGEKKDTPKEEPEKEKEETPARSKRREPELEKEDVPEPELPEKNKCPEGFDYSNDFGEFDECDECAVRKECRAMKRGGKKEPDPPVPKEEEPPPPRRRRA